MTQQLPTSMIVYCDFDGTITSQDCVDFLLKQLAKPEWLDLERQWELGLISSKECMERQIPLIQGGWSAIEACLQEVQLSPGFIEFSQWCQKQTIPLYIVSEGLDRVIQTVLARHKITVDGILSNHLETPLGKSPFLSFPFPPEDSSCGLGMCKCQILECLPSLSRSKTSYRVVIGDGASDFCWASQADLLFAKKKLQSYCEQKQIPFVTFQSFYCIQNHLQNCLQSELKHTVAVPA